VGRADHCARRGGYGHRRYGKSNGWLDDQPAVTVSNRHVGLAYYAGAYLDDDAQAAFIGHVLKAAQIEPPFETPAGVEICPRTSARADPSTSSSTMSATTRLCRCPGAQEHLTRQPIDGTLELDPYEIAVLTKA